MNPAAKCCLGCLCVSVLVLAVLVPVGIFVIAPKMAQGNLNSAHLSIPNATLLPCTTSFVESIITMDLDNDAPVGATLHAFNTTLSTYMCPGNTGGNECAMENTTEVVLGSYMSPAATLKHGTNQIQQTVSMQVGDVSTLLTGFVLPLVMDKKVLLVVTAHDVSMSILGIHVGKLSLRKELTCTHFATSTENPDPKYCGPDAAGPQDASATAEIARRRLQSGFGPMMSCTLGFQNIENKTTILI